MKEKIALFINILATLVYLILGIFLLIQSNYLLLGNSKFSKIFGIVAILYAIMRSMITYKKYKNFETENDDDE